METTSLVRVMRDRAFYRVLTMIVECRNAPPQAVAFAYVERIMLLLEYKLGDYWCQWHEAGVNNGPGGPRKATEFEWFFKAPDWTFHHYANELFDISAAIKRNDEIAAIAKERISERMRWYGWNVEFDGPKHRSVDRPFTDWWVIASTDPLNPPSNSPLSPQRALQRYLTHRPPFSNNGPTAWKFDTKEEGLIHVNFWMWMDGIVCDRTPGIGLEPTECLTLEPRLDDWARKSGWRHDASHNGVNEISGDYIRYICFKRTRSSVAELILLICAVPEIRLGGFGDVLRTITEYVYVKEEPGETA